MLVGMQDEPNPRWLNFVLLAVVGLVILLIVGLIWLDSLPENYF